MTNEVQPTSVSTCVVRTAVVGDIPALLVLYHELHETHRVQHPELFPATVATDPAAVERMLRDNRVGFLVAEFESETGAKLAAFLRVVDTLTPEGGALLSRRFGLVDEVVVLAEYRRLGIASLLLSHAERWASERGLPALEVTVWAFNQEAKDLYLKRGFSTLRHYLRRPLVT